LIDKIIIFDLERRYDVTIYLEKQYERCNQAEKNWFMQLRALSKKNI
jgi:hypothetical protein